MLAISTPFPSSQGCKQQVASSQLPWGVPQVPFHVGDTSQGGRPALMDGDSSGAQGDARCA